MRKTITSSFILLLCLLLVWSAIAWFLGMKTEQNFANYLEKKSQQIESVFHYELLAYDRGIFSAEAKVKLKLNVNNKFAQFIDNASIMNPQQIFKVNLSHGPVLFGKSEIGFGKIALVLKPENDASQDKESLQEIGVATLNKTPSMSAQFSFDDIVKYNIPFKTMSSATQLKGVYYQNTKKHHGSLSIDQWVHQGVNQSLKSKNIQINYKQTSDKHSDKLEYEFSSNTPEIHYAHASLPDKVRAKLNYSGKVSLEGDTLNSNHSLLFDFESVVADSVHPVEKAELKLKMGSLKLSDFLVLHSHINTLRNLHQQSQWILEEQGEFPEGQDQIWRAQDEVLSQQKHLPELLQKVVFIDPLKTKNQSSKVVYAISNATVRFSLKTSNNDNHSLLSGAIFPNTLRESADNDDVNHDSLLSLIQAQAQVKLDNKVFDFLSMHSPISKPSFKLIYKQNKLLMQ